MTADIRERVAEVIAGFTVDYAAEEITDALLEAFPQLAEEQWEYAVRDKHGRILFTATAGAVEGDARVRRRRAGEWETV